MAKINCICCGKPLKFYEITSTAPLCLDCEVKSHAQALGKLGGKVKSQAKAEAARKNGKLGGRPKKRPSSFVGEEK